MQKYDRPVSNEISNLVNEFETELVLIFVEISFNA